MNAETKTAAAPQDDHDLYRSIVLEHARAPHNFGPLPAATHAADGINPLCGDKLALRLRIDADQRIRDARFEGTGCAISIASASILTDEIRGLSLSEAHGVFDRFMAMLDGDTAAPGERLPRALRALGGVRQYPSRVKCATLAWHAMASATRERGDEPVTTE